MSLSDEQGRRTVQLQRIAATLAKAKVFPSLEEAYKAARLILLDYEKLNSITAVNKATSEIAKGVRLSLESGWQDVTKELTETAIYEANWYAQTLGAFAAVKLKTPAKAAIAEYVAKALMVLGTGETQKVGAWANFVTENIDSTVDAFNNAVKAGYVRGATVSEMAKQLRLLTDGLLQRNAESLARTGMQHYAVNAREAMAEANADVIKYRVYSATLDNRTTTLCAGRDGKKWLMTDDSYPRLPAHINCRSAYTFLIDGMEEPEGTRSSVGAQKGEEAAKEFEQKQSATDKKVRYKSRKDLNIFDPKQVKATTNYESFLKQQPVWFQDSVLGKTRADLFRKGGLPLSSFNDMTGRKLTLDDLRIIDADAFTRAGL